VSIPAFSAGGDYFDFLQLPTGPLGLVIGDVSGHGLDSAITMAQTRALVRAAARDHGDPAAILSDVNALLVPDLGDHRFVGMIIVEIDPRTRGFSYANAGHASGYLLDRTGRIKMELASTGIVLGLFEDAVFATAHGPELECGDTFVLFTDGVTEAEALDGTMCGAEWALDIVRGNAHRSAAEILETLCEAVAALADGGGQHDDVTAIVCRVGDWTPKAVQAR
jgi:sigma-B regulation protein RsbU (phosphoserine phosphatase)